MLVIANKLGATIISNGAFDADAQTFFTAVEGGGDTLTATQKSAINKLVVDLKAASIWTKMKALYPIVGGTASSHKWNLKDPRDLDAAYRLVFTGSPTHSSNGIAWNGTTQHATTHLVPSTALTVHSTHLSYYSRTNVVENKYEIGAGTPYFDLGLYGGNLNSDHYAPTVASTAVAATTGFVLTSRTANNNMRIFRNGVSLQQVVTVDGSVALTSQPIYLGALNDTGAAGFRTTKQCAFASIGDGLTSAEVSSFNTAVTTYQTTLGRNV